MTKQVNILLIEPKPLLTDLTKRAIETKPDDLYDLKHIKTVKNITEGTRSLEMVPPHLIFFDVDVEMDKSIPFIISTLKRYPHLKIIILSGKVPDEQPFLDAGAVTVIHLPFQRAALWRKLDQCIGELEQNGFLDKEILPLSQEDIADTSEQESDRSEIPTIENGTADKIIYEVLEPTENKEMVKETVGSTLDELIILDEDEPVKMDFSTPSKDSLVILDDEEDIILYSDSQQNERLEEKQEQEIPDVEDLVEDLVEQPDSEEKHKEDEVEIGEQQELISFTPPQFIVEESNESTEQTIPSVEKKEEMEDVSSTIPVFLIKEDEENEEQVEHEELQSPAFPLFKFELDETEENAEELQETQIIEGEELDVQCKTDEQAQHVTSPVAPLFDLEEHSINNTIQEKEEESITEKPSKSEKENDLPFFEIPKYGEEPKLEEKERNPIQQDEISQDVIDSVALNESEIIESETMEIPSEKEEIDEIPSSTSITAIPLQSTKTDEPPLHESSNEARTSNSLYLENDEYNKTNSIARHSFESGFTNRDGAFVPLYPPRERFVGVSSELKSVPQTKDIMDIPIGQPLKKEEKAQPKSDHEESLFATVKKLFKRR